MIIIAKIWITTEMTAATLNFLGKILCCPPIVNSPKGKPQATRTVIVAITPNNTALNIESINQYSPFAKYKKFQLQIQICFTQYSYNIITYSYQVL